VGKGSAGTTAASGSRRVKFSHTRPGRATRTRQDAAPKVCDSASVARSKSAGDCPDSSPTSTASP